VAWAFARGSGRRWSSSAFRARGTLPIDGADDRTSENYLIKKNSARWRSETARPARMTTSVSWL
jgi:hypothetical protein